MLLFYSKTLIIVYYLLNWNSFSSVRKSWSHVASFAIRVNAIYFVLIDNKPIIAYFFKHQLIGPLLSIKIKPKVEFQS